MCGLSGFCGIRDANTRFNLVVGLGSGIDDRGGHASGYVSIVDKTLRYAKRAGEWMDARYRFIETASKGDLCMMHARWATCGQKDAVAHAHPFAIRRNGKVVLWGAHNGIIYDAWDSAKEHKRHIDVDSQEVFELIADKEYKSLNKLSGYGVITWVEAGQLDRVKLARLSEQSEICVVKVKEGGIVWGSTWDIVKEALEDAELTLDFEYKLDKIGQVYDLMCDNAYVSDLDGVKLDDEWGGAWSYGWGGGYGEYSHFSRSSSWKGSGTSISTKGNTTTTGSGYSYAKGHKWSKEFLDSLDKEDREWLLEDEKEEEERAKKEQQEDEERGRNWMEEYKRMCESDPDDEDAMQERALAQLEKEESQKAAVCISKDAEEDDGAVSVEPPSSDYSIDVLFDDEGEDEDDDTTVDDDFMRMWDKHNNPPCHLSEDEKKMKDGRLERGSRSSRFLLKGI